MRPILRTREGLWYCDAYSHERQAWRIYRVDRFLDVKTAPSSLEPPIPIPTREQPSFPEIHVYLTARGVLLLEHDASLGPRLQRQDNGERWLHLHWRPEELRPRVKLEAQKIARHHAEL